MSELLPLAAKRAIFSLRRRTNKGKLYPFTGSGAAMFACYPSPHSKLPVLPEKEILQGSGFRTFAAPFLFGLCKCERTENTMRYTSKHRLCDTATALVRENP